MQFPTRRPAGPAPAARVYSYTEPHASPPASWWPTFEKVLQAEGAEVLVLPQVALELMRLIADPESSRKRSVDMVTRDPALTAGLLRLANSAYYRGARPCASIQQALARVGDKGLREVLMTASVGRVLNVRGQPDLSLRLQARSMAVALAAEALAAAREMARDDVFAAGLLHDVGWPIAYGVLIRSRHLFGPAVESPAAARAIVDSVHAQAGGLAAATWNLPSSIVAAITHHHQPEAATDGVAAVWLIAGARRIVDALGLYPETECPAIELDPTLDRLHLPPPTLASVASRVREDLVRMQLLAT